MPLELLWTSDGGRNFPPGECNPLNLPSWTWASVKGAVKFETASAGKQVCSVEEMTPTSLTIGDALLLPVSYRSRTFNY